MSNEMYDEQELVLGFYEKINRTDHINTELFLFCKFNEDGDGIERCAESKRLLRVSVFKEGKLIQSEYESEDYVEVDEVMEVHNGIFLEHFSVSTKTKLKLIDRTIKNG